MRKAHRKHAAPPKPQTLFVIQDADGHMHTIQADIEWVLVGRRGRAQMSIESADLWRPFLRNLPVTLVLKNCKVVDQPR